MGNCNQCEQGLDTEQESLFYTTEGEQFSDCDQKVIIVRRRQLSQNSQSQGIGYSYETFTTTKSQLGYMNGPTQPTVQSKKSMRNSSPTKHPVKASEQDQRFSYEKNALSKGANESPKKDLNPLTQEHRESLENEIIKAEVKGYQFFLQENKVARSIESLENAARYCRQIKGFDQYIQARIYFSLAIQYGSAQKLFKRAIEYILMTLRCVDNRIDNSKKMALAILVSIYLMNDGQYENCNQKIRELMNNEHTFYSISESMKVGLYYLQGRCLIKLEKYKEAISVLQKAEAIIPNIKEQSKLVLNSESTIKLTVQAYLNKCLDSQKFEKRGASLEVFEGLINTVQEASKINPQQIYFGIGEAHLKLSKFSDCIGYFQKSLKTIKESQGDEFLKKSIIQDLSLQMKRITANITEKINEDVRQLTELFEYGKV